MPEEFKQTVNLRERLAKPQNNSAKENADMKAKPAFMPAKATRTSKQSRAEEIDRVYNDSEDESADLRRITRPPIQANYAYLYKQIIIVLLLLIIGGGAYWIFFAGAQGKNTPQTNEKTALWYSVKLINGETYYGEIVDTAADPVVLKNVYYNYDQLNSADEQKKESASLRLVKRGNETHGPAGSMEIVRTQVVFMEALKEDSKVLKAILDYEN